MRRQGEDRRSGSAGDWHLAGGSLGGKQQDQEERTGSQGRIGGLTYANLPVVRRLRSKRFHCQGHLHHSKQFWEKEQGASNCYGSLEYKEWQHKRRKAIRSMWTILHNAVDENPPWFLPLFGSAIR